MHVQTKLFEVAAEGGSISIFKIVVKGENKYYYHTQEMKFEDDFSIDHMSNLSETFAEALKAMSSRYPIWHLYPLFCSKQCQKIVLEYLKKYVNDFGHEMSPFRSAAWRELLEFGGK